MPKSAITPNGQPIQGVKTSHGGNGGAIETSNSTAGSVGDSSESRRIRACHWPAYGTLNITDLKSSLVAAPAVAFSVNTVEGCSSEVSSTRITSSWHTLPVSAI